MTSNKTKEIPNINIGQAYDQHYADSEIHYERFEKLADFFGRNMPVHHHDRFYQIHVITRGSIRVHLDQTPYIANAPMFIFTPPTVPHAFVTDTKAIGHVLTVRQQLVWELLGIGASIRGTIASAETPLCVAINPKTDSTANRLLSTMDFFEEEFEKEDSQRPFALKSLLQLVLIDISRLAHQHQPHQDVRKEDIRIFHAFNQLIEEHYRNHLSLSDYADKIGVTEARLNEICRRLADLPSKRLIMDRVMQEARRLLSFTSMPVTEIAYELGFKDPAYFARYFRRNAEMTASDYRQSQMQV